MADTLFDRERAALARLRAVVRARAADEAAVAGVYSVAAEEAEKEVQKARRQLSAAKTKTMDELDEAYQQAIVELADKYSRRKQAADKMYAEGKRSAVDRFEGLHEQTEAEFRDRVWTHDSLLEAGEKEADDQLQKLRRVSSTARTEIGKAWARVQPMLGRVGLDKDDVAFPVERLPPPTNTDPEGKLERCLEDIATASARVETSFLPRLAGLTGALALAVVGAVAGFAGGYVAADVKGGAVGAATGTILGGFVLFLIIRYLATRQVRDRATALGVYQAEASRAADTLEAHAQATCENQKAELRRRHQTDRKRTSDHFQPRLAALERQRDMELDKAEVEFADRTDRMKYDRSLETRAEDEKATQSKAEAEARLTAEAKTIEERYARKMTAASAVRDRDWRAFSDRWFDSLADLSHQLGELVAVGDDAFPPWSALPTKPAPDHVPAGVRYGQFTADLFAMPDGEPNDARLTPPPPTNWKLPAFLPFPDDCSVLLQAADEGRPAAVSALQAMMLRFLTGLPPGKVRFTIIDPVGLGENFAAFMHLADYDEQLVGARIWTEASQIEQRLADTTEHMENVIQKYLRNQYKSIEEYNKAAGEVAEPYRVLVIANFPTNFTPDAARRLVSIMSSGPSCGVCTLVSVDTHAALPRDFRLADLEQVAFNLHWKDGTFRPADAELAAFPLVIDAPPPPAEVASLVRRVGAASKDASRVEVPFEFIMPKPAEVWAGSTAKGFDIPIGRAGATKRQLFAVGRGTAQHALVAGKTGSGKSTLLHALITNLALCYSPDEAELYLIDFKKGVEFEAYARHKLPHARVIAIESEREFGLSVLQKLDAVLKDRGDKFRAAGVNDLAGYRDYLKSNEPNTACPRILLVVDEFQEFFVEDDKLAQEAGLLLDRLVRQGRAFGLHVLLGSQTLGGAYSLARSTIDQMAVRIALQCSDADAQLILSKDNSAARLLSRPGEAIYNDANGLVEGNDPFQVVWLSEDKREELLDGVRQRANGAHKGPLVFAGNLAAELSGNLLLETAGEQKVPTAWLGDAIAIKDPTAAVFRPQSAANLLLIGQSEEAAQAVIAAAVLSLSKQGSPTFTILDGTPDDADSSDYLRKLTTARGLSKAVIERSELAAAINDLAAELARRQSGESTDRSPRFLIVHALHRFRELRKTDDGYGGFGRQSDKTASPGDQFATLLRDGPPVGIHVIVWCDSLTNLNRAVDRTGIREFGMRVLFQMSANDSSTLIDTPVAAKLGRNRALFTQDDMERPEKFRPYGPPAVEWVKSLS